MTMAGTLHIITTPFPQDATALAAVRAALANADDIICCDEHQGAMLLHSIAIASPVTGLDQRLPVAEVAAIVQALRDGHMIAALIRADHARDVDVIHELAATCRTEGLSVLPEQEPSMPTRKAQPIEEQAVATKKRRTTKKSIADATVATAPEEPLQQDAASVPVTPKRRLAAMVLQEPLRPWRLRWISS